MRGLPRGSEGKESAYNTEYLVSIPGLGTSPGAGNGNPLQYSCLEIPRSRGTWRATVHRVSELDTTKRQTLSLFFPPKVITTITIFIQHLQDAQGWAKCFVCVACSFLIFTTTQGSETVFISTFRVRVVIGAQIPQREECLAQNKPTLPPQVRSSPGAFTAVAASCNHLGAPGPSLVRISKGGAGALETCKLPGGFKEQQS